MRVWARFVLPAISPLVSVAQKIIKIALSFFQNDFFSRYLVNGQEVLFSTFSRMDRKSARKKARVEGGSDAKRDCYGSDSEDREDEVEGGGSDATDDDESDDGDYPPITHCPSCKTPLSIAMDEVDWEGVFGPGSGFCDTCCCGACGRRKSQDGHVLHCCD